MITRKNFLYSLFIAPFVAKPALKAATKATFSTATDPVTGITMNHLRVGDRVSFGGGFKIGDTLNIRIPERYKATSSAKFMVESICESQKTINYVHSETARILQSNLQFNPRLQRNYEQDFKPQPVQLQLLTDEEMDEHGYRDDEEDYDY